MNLSTPQGITPPTPGLDHEEPELATEDDIPRDDEDPAAARDERGSQGERG